MKNTYYQAILRSCNQVSDGKAFQGLNPSRTLEGNMLINEIYTCGKKNHPRKRKAQMVEI